MTITDVYKQRHAGRMAGLFELDPEDPDYEVFGRPTHIAVGSGTLTSGEASKLTALVNEVARQPITARWRTGGNSDIARFSAIFTKGVGNATWKEIGLFNAGSGGDMLVRDENADGYCTKTASQVKVVVCQLRISG